jgi:hypothetical protein
MATEPERRARLVGAAGWAWLLVLLVFTGRLALILWRELGRLGAVDAATLLDRGSQLKPWPWKAPLSVVALVALVLVFGAVAATLWIAAGKRLRRRAATGS